MKRILLVTTSYPDRGEGEAAAGMFVRDFALALQAEGAEVHVVAPAIAASQTLESELFVARFAAPKLPLSLLNPTHPTDWPSILNTLAAGQHAVMKACDSFKPDHILALWALPSGAWAEKAGKRYAIPYSTWALGSDIWSLGKIPLIRQYLGHIMRQADHRFADGIQLSRDVTDLSGEDCSFLPSSRSFGPPISRQLSTKPPYRMAFLGRWHANKGVDILLEVLETLAPEDWENISAIRINGGGPLEVDVAHRCRNLQEAGFPLEIGGYLDLQGARELFEWTDFIVIPSRIESIPVVFSDAMQASRPVIASPVGDLPHLIQTYGCGLLAEHPNASSLLTAIRKALTTTPQKFGSGIKLAAAEFSIGTTAQHFLEVIAS